MRSACGLRKHPCIIELVGSGVVTVEYLVGHSCKFGVFHFLFCAIRISIDTDICLFCGSGFIPSADSSWLSMYSYSFVIIKLMVLLYIVTYLQSIANLLIYKQSLTLSAWCRAQKWAAKQQMHQRFSICTRESENAPKNNPWCIVSKLSAFAKKRDSLLAVSFFGGVIIRFAQFVARGDTQSPLALSPCGNGADAVELVTSI